MWLGGLDKNATLCVRGYHNKDMCERQLQGEIAEFYFPRAKQI